MKLVILHVLDLCSKSATNNFMKWSFILCVNIFYLSIIIYLLKNQTTNNIIEEDDDPFNISGKCKNQSYFPPPQRKNNKFESLYIAIFDDEYEPKPYQCLMKKQWIDPFSHNPFIDGIEMYSLTYFHNKECNLSTISIPLPAKRMKDPSSWQIYNILKSFLERSKSAWLFLVGPAAFIQEENFFYFFKHLLNEYTDEYTIMSRGCCIEPSYYFQILQISSGVFISRRSVEKILQLNEFWNVVFSIEIDGNEALFHALDQIGVIASQSNSIGMIGDAFLDEKDFERLLTKNFEGLPQCQTNIERDRTCIEDPQLFLSMISWAGGGKNNRTFFLQNAEKMIKDVKPNLGIVWIGQKPKLCMI